jgi:hypothetical protein
VGFEGLRVWLALRYSTAHENRAIKFSKIKTFIKKPELVNPTASAPQVASRARFSAFPLCLCGRSCDIDGARVQTVALALSSLVPCTQENVLCAGALVMLFSTLCRLVPTVARMLCM